MDLIRKGVDVYATAGTHKTVGTVNEKRAKTFKAMDNFTVGNFKILAFDVKHDAAEPVGFLIYHPECGKVLFLTDCNYCKYVFPGLNNIIIEANFSKKIIDQKFGKDSKNEFLRNRILRNHFSIEHCEDMLKKHDLKDVINIVLIHLSDSNSNEVEFKSTIEKATYKHVTVAQKGTDINFNKLPF